MILRLSFCILIAVALFSCGSEKKQENSITVFCASSLSPVVSQIKEAWEKTHKEQIIINTASSGTLARQIENGAQADIFLSASPEWTAYLIQTLKLSAEQKIFAQNRLAIILPVDAQLDSMGFEQFLEKINSIKGKIAVADPAHVPLGKYTKEALDFYHIYIQPSDRFILNKDARSTLRLVEMGEANLGFVYLSDALTSDEVHIAALIPDISHQPIVYESLILSDHASAMDFYQFLTSTETGPFWRKFGFQP